MHEDNWPGPALSDALMARLTVDGTFRAQVADVGKVRHARLDQEEEREEREEIKSREEFECLHFESISVVSVIGVICSATLFTGQISSEQITLTTPITPINTWGWNPRSLGQSA